MVRKISLRNTRLPPQREILNEAPCRLETVRTTSFVVNRIKWMSYSHDVPSPIVIKDTISNMTTPLNHRTIDSRCSNSVANHITSTWCYKCQIMIPKCFSLNTILCSLWTLSLKHILLARWIMKNITWTCEIKIPQSDHKRILLFWIRNK